MGGMGSGRRWHLGAKDTTDDLRRLDVRRWARDGLLDPGNTFQWQWSRNGAPIASINVRVGHTAVHLVYRVRNRGGDWRDMDYPVHLDRTPCTYGGHRVWFLCPARGCGRRVALLYGGTIFACRHCHDLAYPVQREDKANRAARKAEKVRARLGWEGGILDMAGGKPKGMHWRTYHRLVAEAEDSLDASLQALRMHFR